MQCPSCQTELLHQSNFCPVCGGGLLTDAPTGQESPPTGATAATGGRPALVVHSGAGDTGAVHESGSTSRPPAAHLPSHQVAGYNVLGEPVMSDAYYEALADRAERRRRGARRPTGTVALALTIVLLAIAIGAFAAFMQRGYGQAQSGIFVLLAAFCWIWYVSMSEDQHHPSVMRQYEAFNRFVDARVEMLRRRTGLEMEMRRQRERFDTMRGERLRRIQDLGEATYRMFREGAAPPPLQSQATRVLSIEQQMLVQEQRLSQLRSRRHGDKPVANPEDPPASTTGGST